MRAGSALLTVRPSLCVRWCAERVAELLSDARVVSSVAVDALLAEKEAVLRRLQDTRQLLLPYLDSTEWRFERQRSH